MALVTIGIGTNTNPTENIQQGIKLLRQYYPILQVSPFYKTPAIGHIGAPYWNGVVTIQTDHTPSQIKQALINIEDACGRVRWDVSGNKSTIVALDFDILLYDQQILTYDEKHHIPHADITRFAHVAIPLADILPDGIHPETQEIFSTIAEKFSHSDIRLMADFVL